jgi:phenylalanyl-tRNA synthetase beta chain
VEPVKIVSEHNKESRETPDLTPRLMVASVSYLNECTGLTLTPQEQCDLIKKMGLKAVPSKGDKDSLDVSVPITRTDILHQADMYVDPSILILCAHISYYELS